MAETSHRKTDRAADLSIGKITLLNQTAVLGNPIDWRCEGQDVSHLWRFNLHYHEFLLGVVSDTDHDEGPAPQVMWNTMTQWIDANPISSPDVHMDAWHPFCISRRLLVWFRLLSTFTHPVEFRENILKSAWQQTFFLNDHLEKDVGGNHLLENLRAIAVAATCLNCDETEAWKNTVGRHLPTQLDDQILDSGEHFERAPHYHVEMLDVLCDLADCTASWSGGLSDPCRESRDKMARFLQKILHPDGDIPLLSDGCLDGTETIQHLLRRSRGVQPSTDDNPAETVGDYWVYRNKNDFLIFDGGPICPNHLPAHSHSDLLNFEASINGNRFIVDTGTFQYEEGPTRDHVRSTQAHNCLEIDATNQCDVWSRFRVGHRGTVSGFRSGRSCEFCWATAHHDAYRDLGIPKVHRLVICHPACWWIIDWCNGRGHHTLCSHLHVVGAIERETDNRLLVTDDEQRRIWIEQIGDASLTTDACEYYPDFGVAKPISRATITRKSILPAWSGWWIRWSDLECACHARIGKNGILDVRIDGECGRFAWTNSGDGVTKLD